MTSPTPFERWNLLAARLEDRRSRRVVLLSHCLLNENTRYLGGACRRCTVREIVDQCQDQGVGIVQMPCPEEAVWGGVLKRRILALYGGLDRNPVLHRLRKALLPLAVLYTRLRYRWMAGRIAAQVQDYLASGYSVLGVVGVDGSPSCGVRTTLHVPQLVDAIAALDPSRISVDEHNSVLRRNAGEGSGMFIEELRREFKRRGLEVGFLAHDLFAELDGRPSGVRI